MHKLVVAGAAVTFFFSSTVNKTRNSLFYNISATSQSKNLELKNGYSLTQ